MFNTEILSWPELLMGIQGQVIQGTLDQQASGVSTDTRTLQKGDLFIALNGPNFNGHRFIPQAFEKGAAAALVSEEMKAEDLPAGKCIIRVENTITALGDLAALWRNIFSVPLIGISGSNGKTTTKEMLTTILQQEGMTLKNQGNLNNWIGLPLSLFALNKDHRFAVMEMGMNHRGEISRLCQIARPDVGLLTNVGPAHLEGLGSMEAIAEAKGELFESLEPHHWAVINIDDSRIRERAHFCRARKMTFGLNPAAMVRADKISLAPLKSIFRIHFQGEAEDVVLPVPGEHNIPNALGAAGAALSLGLSLSKVRDGLNKFILPEHRLQIKKGLKGIELIDDTYNANPASLKAALSTFQSFRQGKGGGVVLGDMLELGNQALEAHREIGKLIGKMGLDYLLVIGPLSGEIVKEALEGDRPPQQTFWAQRHVELLERLYQIIRPGDILLIKGSHGMNMETIVRGLEDQG
jgi:UDP-N-acetylmuramoyl-tripeptide--D-alanyl-D-alanine ligase